MFQAPDVCIEIGKDCCRDTVANHGAQIFNPATSDVRQRARGNLPSTANRFSRDGKRRVDARLFPIFGSSNNFSKLLMAFGRE